MQILGNGEMTLQKLSSKTFDVYKARCLIKLEQNMLLIDQKQMEVCEVCGSFLIVNDAQARVEEHISGKQHMGYAKLRLALEDIRVGLIKYSFC